MFYLIWAGFFICDCCGGLQCEAKDKSGKKCKSQVGFWKCQMLLEYATIATSSAYICIIQVVFENLSKACTKSSVWNG